MLNKLKGPLACNFNVSLTELQCFSLSLEWVDSGQGDVAHPGKQRDLGSTPLNSKLNLQY